MQRPVCAPSIAGSKGERHMRVLRGRVRVASGVRVGVAVIAALVALVGCGGGGGDSSPTPGTVTSATGLEAGTGSGSGTGAVSPATGASAPTTVDTQAAALPPARVTVAEYASWRTALAAAAPAASVPDDAAAVRLAA